MEAVKESIRLVRGESSRVGDILTLLQEAATWMKLNGINQWRPEQFNEADVANYFIDRHVYLALENESVVGMFTLQFSDPQYWGSKNDDNYAYLHRLAIRGSHRKQGLGRYMLKYAVGLVRELGCKGLRFDTVAHNIKLNRYYQSLGFHYMGTNDMGNGRLVNLYQHFEEEFDPHHLILRYMSESDFEHMRRWSISSEYLKQWAGPSLTYPLEDDQLVKYLEGANHPGHSDRLIFSAIHEAEQKVVGHISLSNIDRNNRSARISRVVVDPEYQGKGFAKRMVREVQRIGFEGLELHRLSLGAFDFNTAALRAYESVGFKQEGIQREAALFGNRYVDCVEMSILDREWFAYQNR